MNKREKLLKCLNAPHGMNRVYFGGMATAKMCRILGLEYGEGGVKEAIEQAHDYEINLIYQEMGDHIESVWEHGVQQCQPELNDTIWVRLGEYRTTPPPSQEGWVEYKRYREV